MFNPPMPRPTSEYMLEPEEYPTHPFQQPPQSSPPLEHRERDPIPVRNLFFLIFANVPVAYLSWGD